MHPGDEVGAVDPIEPAARAERLADALINAEQVMRHGIGLRRRDKPLIYAARRAPARDTPRGRGPSSCDP
jgi:hypothetical protein